MSKARAWLIAAIGAVLAFRVAVVATWHAPAGDGVQYWKLANELRRAGRFAYAANAPLAWSRLPGYPWLARLLWWQPAPLERHVVALAAWNLPFAFATAYAVFLIVLELHRTRRAAIAAGFVALLYPSMVLVGSYALTETVSTLLATLEILFLLRALRERAVRWCALAGLMAGLGQLVRADAMTVTPALVAVLIALPRPQKLRAGAAFVLAAVLSFAPWLVRNQIQFGAPHPFASTWRTMDGRPLPDGAILWARTWAGSRPGDGYYELLLANDRDVDVEHVILPSMYDDEAEHQALRALLASYNRERLSPSVDARFRELAAARRASHPFRTWVTLPLERIAHLYAPEPIWEMPMNVPWLGLPAARPAFGAADYLLFAAAAIGFYFLARARRAWLLVLLLPLAARTALYGWAIPHGTTGRYLFEVVPILIVAAVIAVESLLKARRAADAGS